MKFQKITVPFHLNFDGQFKLQFLQSNKVMQLTDESFNPNLTTNFSLNKKDEIFYSEFNYEFSRDQSLLHKVSLVNTIDVNFSSEINLKYQEIFT